MLFAYAYRWTEEPAVRFQDKIAIVPGAARGNASLVTGQILAVDGGQIVRL